MLNKVYFLKSELALFWITRLYIFYGYACLFLADHKKKIKQEEKWFNEGEMFVLIHSVRVSFWI